MAFAGGYQSKEHGGGMAAGVGAQEGPVVATDGDASQGAFSDIVVDAQFAVGGVDAESFPLIDGVGDRLADRAFWDDVSAVFDLSEFEPFFELVQAR